MTKLREGDRVEITLVGEVVGADGLGFIVLDNDVHVWTRTENMQIRKLAPRKPEAGDVISGRRLKETPWRQGTVIRFVSDDMPPSRPHILKWDGTWHGTQNDSWDWFGFDFVEDNDEIEVLFVA